MPAGDFPFSVKKYTMQQFLLLLTPPRFSIGYTALNILRIQGLLHATPYAFSFMLEYTRHKIFLSCHGRAELDAAGFIRAEENDKRTHIKNS